MWYLWRKNAGIKKYPNGRLIRVLHYAMKLKIGQSCGTHPINAIISNYVAFMYFAISLSEENMEFKDKMVKLSEKMETAARHLPNRAEKDPSRTVRRCRAE